MIWYTYIHCETIPTTELTHASPHIFISLFFKWEQWSSTLLANLNNLIALPTIVTITHRSPDLISVLPESLCPFANLFLSPLSPIPWQPPLDTTSMSSAFCLFVFLDSTDKWYDVGCVILCLAYFTLHNPLELHLCCKWQDFLLFKAE